MRKDVLAGIALAFMAASIPAFASDGLGKNLNLYYGTTNLSFGGLTYTGNNGGTIPNIRISSPYNIGNFYLGISSDLSFGHINGLRADRYTFNIEPGWIFPINKDLAFVPYIRLAALGQAIYGITGSKSAHDSHISSGSNVKFGYNIGGGAAVQWSPVNRLVIVPSFDISYYRQGYDAYENDHSKYTAYISTSEYRERLGVYYYLTNWLDLGINIGADQYGTGGGSIVSYDAGLGVNF